MSCLIVWNPPWGDRSPLCPAFVLYPALIERLLDWRVDGLISDYPDRVRAAMARRGMPLPASLR